MVLNVLLWLDLMNRVKMGSSWPRGSGALLDMIFSVAFACTGSALTTMAHLREPVNMCRDLDPGSKQSFYLMMNSRAGQGAQERPVQLSVTLCCSLKHTSVWASGLRMNSDKVCFIIFLFNKYLQKTKNR